MSVFNVLPLAKQQVEPPLAKQTKVARIEKIKKSDQQYKST